MRRTLPLLMIPLAAACVLSSASGQGDPVSLLRRAATAERHLAFTGTKVVRYSTRGPDESVVRIWHQPPDKTRIEGRWLTVVDAGDRSAVYNPWEKRWVSPPVRRFNPPLSILLRNYTVREAGRATIAGRSTRVIQVRPRYPGSRQENVWIDDETGLKLRSELLDPEGKVISFWQFQEIKLLPAIPALLFKTPDPEPDDRDKIIPIAKPDFTVLTPRYLPRGFVEVRRSTFRHHDADRVFVQYSDGLSMILLTQRRNVAGSEASGFRHRRWPLGPQAPGAAEEAGPGPRYQPPPRHEPKRGGEGDAMARLSWIQGDLRLTLAGGVDRRQLQKIADSVSSTAPAASASRLTTRH